jgi:hypothetical protein
VEEVIADSSRKSKWFRLDPSYLVLALLPWLVLAVTSAWMFNPWDGIDPWIYLGYFLNYPRYVAELFPDRYYGSRLPWVLPGYCLHALFDPLTARYVLHIGFYYLAVFSLYAILRKSVGSRSALLVAVLFGTHSYFLLAIGRDYVDGAGITYFLLALLCISRAVTSPRPHLWLMASGAAAAAMFYCNAFLAVFIPLPPAFYLYQVHKGLTSATLRGALQLALWLASGALLVTLLLGVVSYLVGGGFWFYWPSLQFIGGTSPRDHATPILSWIHKGFWLAFPFITAIASISYLTIGLLRKTFVQRDPKLFYILQCLFCLGVMIAWYMAGGAGLRWWYYASYLLPSAFLAMGCVLASPLERWPALAYWPFLALTAVAFAVTLGSISEGLGARVQFIGWITLAVAIALGLTLNNFLRNRWPLLILTLGGLWLAQAGFQLPYNSDNGAADLAHTVEAAKLVSRHTHEDALVFWYDAKEPLGRLFSEINSCYLYGWAMVSNKFPALAPNHPVQEGTEGVILSSRNDALQQANRTLSGIHLHARNTGTSNMDGDGVKYQMIFFRLEPLNATGREVPLKLAPEKSGVPSLSPAAEAVPFPSEQWTVCKYQAPDGGLELRPDGVHVTTHKDQYGYIVQYGPFHVAQSGYYRFVLEYDNLRGGLHFGAISEDPAHFVVPQTEAERNGRGGTRTSYGYLTSGQPVVLIVSNFVRYPPGHASTFVIKSVRAYGTFSE